MTDRSITRLLRGVVAVGSMAALAGWAALAFTDRPSVDLAALTLAVSTMAVGFSIVVWIAAGSQPRNRVLWVLAGYVAGIGVVAAGTLVIAVSAPEVALPMDVETQVPADLPSTVAWIHGWTTAVGTLGFYGMLTFGLLLFPDGTLPSPRWRPIAAILGVGLVALSIGQILMWHPDNTVAPFDTGGIGHQWAPMNLFVILGPIVALVGMVVRFFRSDPEGRSQLKWIMWGAAVLVPASLIGIVIANPLFTLVGAAVFVTAYGIAVTKYRLFDVDLVISRTFVYGSLAVFIAVLYVAVVVGIGALLGSADEVNTGLAIAATAVVAVAFQPMRRWLERIANRLVYGRKATPYEVLSDFSQRVAATSDTRFDDAARSLAEGTRATRVVISLSVDGEAVEAASWPEQSGDGQNEIVRFRIEDDEKELGSLDLYLPPGQELKVDDRRLAEELASGMGLALRNQLLTERLAARVDDLRESRRRLVALQDETRRRLERDLHDGAQQQLVALKVKLRLGRGIAEKEGARQTAALLEQSSATADVVVDTIRDFARGVYPPLLEAEGLGAAITAQARRAPIPIDVESDGIGRYERGVEAAIYFCVLEALRYGVRHAGASRASVKLSQNNGSVSFEVLDDGGERDISAGDIAIMTDRVDAIAGSLHVTSTPGEGTTIAGTIPTTVEVSS
jgi:signal transduction histidine kinase